jgi:mono/diheme cytochrome c family protein
MICVPDPNKPADRNRGAYLVDGLGHCGTCHTTKNILGGDKRDGYLQGAVVQGWFVPNITSDSRVGIGEWPLDEIVDYLKAGANQWAVVSGPMAEEVKNQRPHDRGGPASNRGLSEGRSAGHVKATLLR